MQQRNLYTPQKFATEITNTLEKNRWQIAVHGLLYKYNSKLSNEDYYVESIVAKDNQLIIVCVGMTITLSGVALYATSGISFLMMFDHYKVEFTNGKNPTLESENTEYRELRLSSYPLAEQKEKTDRRDFRYDKKQRDLVKKMIKQAFSEQKVKYIEIESDEIVITFEGGYKITIYINDNEYNFSIVVSDGKTEDRAHRIFYRQKI
jgi:hypothetical protein